MIERYARRILDHLSHRQYEPRTVHELAVELSIPKEELRVFREAVEQLLAGGQVVLGSAEVVLLPPPGREMVGVFRRHERGFGFLVPDELTQHGDLFIPPGNTGDAMTGDRVRAKVRHEGRRNGHGGGGGQKSPYTGEIVEILQRAERHYVGTLEQRGRLFVVQVDGRMLQEPVLIRDPHAKNARPGDKVVVELLGEPTPDSGRGEMPEGVILEVLGEAGEPEVETLAVMRAYGLVEKFSPTVLDQARMASRAFADDSVPADREDLTELFICTIDPPDAKDFDDAISIRRLEGEGEAVWELGVHIADVSYFVESGSELDEEAYRRGNSTYLPRRVIPMLPELLSNGVCSLQEGVNRFTKSCFIRYDAEGRVVGQRFSRSVIRSAKRLTYLEAQALIDGDLREARKHAKSTVKYPKPLLPTLGLMNELARTIRQRRLDEGMIVLGLPEVTLVFDETGRVVDAMPEDNAFTHTLIEMFMVEANEAAARLFDGLDVPMIRRIHPDPDAHDITSLRAYARVAGFNIPARPSRKELQALLDAVRGKPAQHAVHLAVLRTLNKAEYAPMRVGHFALASEHYTHFTSPIRRYPDLVVHRGIAAVLAAEAAQREGKGRRNKRQIARAVAGDRRVPDELGLRELGRHCSNTERNSESAERELRSYLVMELLTEHLGEDFDGTVTGVTSAGVFMQIDRYLVDGMIRTTELPGSADERWKLNPNTGALVAQRSGRTITIGDRFIVRIAKIDLARRQMDLVIVDAHPSRGFKKAKASEAGRPAEKGEKKTKRTQPAGARKAHEQTKKIKQVKKKQAKAAKKSAGGASARKSKPRRGGGGGGGKKKAG